jgi:hypothetical protein
MALWSGTVGSWTHARTCQVLDGWIDVVVLVAGVADLQTARQGNLGPVCLGCGWLAVQEKLLCRESCCVGKAAISSFTVWQLDWLSGCMLKNCLKYP